MAFFVQHSLDLATQLVGFGRSLRDRGMLVGPDQISRYCSAVAMVDPSDVFDLYWAGRACLVNKRDDIATYDEEFQRFFLGIEDEGLLPEKEGPLRENIDESKNGSTGPTGVSTDRASDGQPEGDLESEGEEIGAVASVTEVLRLRSLATWTEDELRQLPSVMALIKLRLPVRQTRRLVPAQRGPRLDVRRTVRRSMRHEGELLTRAWRARRHRPRRVVFLMDVSGSMSAHSRALLHFAYVLLQTELRLEVFCFGTRLTRVTDLLDDRSPNRAVDQASSAVADWSGGTRIGESLALFLRVWGRRGILRGAVLLLASDGLERGDPNLLAQQMARLKRLTHAIVWLNPLKGDPTYQPLARGMRAALPHVDRLVAADTVADLEQVALLIPQVT